jgi:hypothetical protein
MMVIGQLHGQPYVIHDVGGMSYRKADGSKAHVKLNAVSVTPLPLPPPLRWSCFGLLLRQRVVSAPFTCKTLPFALTAARSFSLSHSHTTTKSMMSRGVCV